MAVSQIKKIKSRGPMIQETRGLVLISMHKIYYLIIINITWKIFEFFFIVTFVNQL